MTGYLTTHVLDTARGCPGEGIKIELFRVSGNSHRKIASAVTNADGRTDAPILNAEKFGRGTFELVFFVGDYLRRLGAPEDQVLFLDEIPLRFGMSEDAHYHVPLLLSPYGYSTYRGS
ncbi:MAG: hydroxyisourate hydrolase [Silicimonas sp.]|jgi:5-hydroxyisourate hydrolase|nr:hydroxyisourate hydrolase [Silicimonas sp.]